jgi:deoxyribodipyrimidine photo-lyase
MTATIWWIRRDLRLVDNPALQAALASGGRVIPLFILDKNLLSLPAERRKNFLLEGLKSLDHDLKRAGSRLVVRVGEAVPTLQQILGETGAERIFAEEDFTPSARRRDDAVRKELPLTLLSGLTVHHPTAIVKSDGRPYSIFTPFSKAWKALPLPGATETTVPAIPPMDENLVSTRLPDSEPDGLFPRGEQEARQRLSVFLSGPIWEYHEKRNWLDRSGTSILSPYLRFGMLSPRQIVQWVLRLIEQSPTQNAELGCETWLDELIWREFYQAVLYHFPQVLREAFNPALRDIPWRDAPEDLHAWQQGQTGFPVVDAAMRQLVATGWMHNRARMITASFLTKDLLIDWQEGENWFMRQLVDGDPAANNGGWQWTAGVGTDAAPYFRIFNPILQGQEYDPDGTFVRRWIPELEKVPQTYLHEPWRMPLDIQQSCRCVIGKNYPAPLVDHQVVRNRTLTAYQDSQHLYRGERR